MSNKLNFFVYFYNDSNIGDDLFLDLLVRRYPHFNFHIHDDKRSPTLNQSFHSYKNLFFAEVNLSNKTLKSEIYKYDGVIVIGGSVFQDSSYMYYRGHIGRYLVFKQLIKTGKKVFVLGANLGPFNTAFGKVIFKATLKHVTNICVRDSYSFGLLQEWGISKKCVAPDIIFGYDFQHMLKPDNKKNALGISILNTKLNPDIKPIYIRKMAELSNLYLSHSKDSTVRLFGFDGGRENDGEVIDEVMKLIKFSDRVVKMVYNKNTNIVSFLRLLIECRYIIACRFHSMVLAAKYGIPFYPIVYSEKTSNVLDDVGYDLGRIKYSKINDLNVVKLFEDIVNINYSFSLSTSICDDSKKHFASLDLVNSHQHGDVG